MRVLHVAETVRGGIASYLSDVIRWQNDKYGVENVLVSVPSDNIEDITSVKNEQLQVVGNYKRDLFSLLKYIVELRRQIIVCKPDVVHAHSSFAGAAVRIICIFMWKRPKVVYCPHGWSFLMGVARWKLLAYAFIERILSYRSDAIINISQYELKKSLEIGIKKSVSCCVYNGVSEFPNFPSNSSRSDDIKIKKFLFVGRFDLQKGLDVLLRVAKHLLGSPIIFYVVGAGVRDCGEIAISDNVVMYEWRSREQLAELYFKSDALIVPSRWEGFGLVAVEAMSCGKAVIASSNGALPEIVIDGVTGVIFDLDDEEYLGKLLQRVTCSELEYMGQKGKERYKQYFHSDKMNAGIHTVYQKVISSNYGSAYFGN